MSQKINNLRKRHNAEKRFILAGKIAIAFSLFFLIILFAMIISKGYGAFIRTKIAIEIDKNIDPKSLNSSNDYREIIKNSLVKIALNNKTNDSKNIDDLSAIYSLVSKISNLELQESYAKINKNSHNAKNQNLAQYHWLSASSKVDMFFKYGITEGLSELQIKVIKNLHQQQRVKKFFNWEFFQFGDSREPEVAGIKSSFIGSILVMLVFLLCAFPIAISCAFYLEEFAPKNRFTDIIEISINNLAGIPSIIYGLLGLILYLQLLHLPRSSTLVGGLTLFMLVLPVIIIATRNTIRSIPASIRDGALAIGASKIQVIWHHLLPLSIPGIMTGTILAISRALGETAPLLMIGMVAFIADTPQSFFEPSSALAVQIYLWSDLPEIGFVEKTSGAILILLTFLILLNLSAIILRKKFERKW